MIVLVIASPGYNHCSFELGTVAGTGVKQKDFLLGSATFVIVKYFCPIMHRLVTLGCYMCHLRDKLGSMVDTFWLQERLQSYVGNNHVAPLVSGMTLHCWKEMTHMHEVWRLKPDMTLEEQDFNLGDIVIWQPSSCIVQKEEMTQVSIEDLASMREMW